MKSLFVSVLALALVGAAPIPAPTPALAPKPFPAPSEIVAAAPAREWVAIPPADVLVMTLGNGKQVLIQLVPPPFSQGWVGNIRKLAAAHWWDGLSVNRVQDNYVVQWGDASEKKALPDGLAVMQEREYVTSINSISDAEAVKIEIKSDEDVDAILKNLEEKRKAADEVGMIALEGTRTTKAQNGWHERDSVAEWVEIHRGWPLASDRESMWPVHCYGMVGVGRNFSPDTGTGAELYTVIGHAPRHLDRNIAVVGRVIAGIENLSSLPRGTGALGFYEKPEERAAITSIRLANKLPAAAQPRFEYLSTESKSFAAYADARANRRDPFFIKPAGGADICNIPVPVRKKP